MDMKKLLTEILAEMAEKGMVFSNEQNFQFELALAIKDKENIKDVKLEAMSLPKDWDGKIVRKNDREYTDIVVETTDGKFYAIEVKDKHSNKKEEYYSDKFGRIVLMNHGAEYYNSFYFWEDVRRLEKINSRDFFKEITIEKGYSLFLSNDSKYWNPGEIKDNLWRLYSMEENREVERGSLGTQEDLKEKNVFKGRFPDIVHSYTLKWENYPAQVCKDKTLKEKIAEDEFRYLLLEVLPS